MYLEKIKTLISRLWEISQNRSLLFGWLYLFVYWIGSTRASVRVRSQCLDLFTQYHPSVNSNRNPRQLVECVGLCS